MQRMLPTLTALSALMAGPLTGAAAAQTLTITVSLPGNQSEGTLMLGVFDSQESFDQGEIVMGLSQIAQVGLNQIAVPNLPNGTFGISVFLDINGDGELNRNLLGAPTEPFGFTRNPRIRFSAPGFDAFSFDYTGQGGEMIIDLNGL